MTRPEVLAPAGDEAALEAALGGGADAVYFGLASGFNARARAQNFTLEGLPATVRRIHEAGARAYVTLNTLVFEDELPAVEALVRAVALAGADAVIVQDPAVALLARAVAPTLHVHASTQMTIANRDAVRFAASLGVVRVVAPREHSVDEIAGMGRELELEVFVHGALCVSYSGQCLTSEAWGGRSANRGQCAQSCRLPYDLVVDGETRDLGDVRYLLSPKDLAGLAAVPALAEVGVTSLKIEGRQKGPSYVAVAVDGYARAVRGEAGADDLDALSLTYSRGFSDGFLGGSDHQTLVEGRFPKHRGRYAGRVESVDAGRRKVVVRADPAGRPWTGGLALDRREGPVGDRKVSLPVLDAPPPSFERGVGVVFDAGHPERDEQGGPVFSVETRRDRTELGFGRPGPDLTQVSVGDRVWITSDPAVERRATKVVSAPRAGRIGLRVRASGAVGEPLSLSTSLRGRVVTVATQATLAPARGAGLDEALLADKLGGLGETPFSLEAVDASDLAAGAFVPVSALKTARRELVAALSAELSRPHAVTPLGLVEVRAALPDVPSREAAPLVVPLCRTDAQLDGAIDAGATEVELDWMERVGLGRAFEEGLDDALVAKRPDAVLVRHFGALERLASSGVPLHGDFSLNVTNAVTGRLLLSRGLEHVTASFDLDETQLHALLAAMPRGRVAVVVHHRIPMFHTEHCVYAHLLSEGRDFRSCGRPCEAHAVSLRDRKGQENPVIVDAGCRNTVFESKAQSAARLVPDLVAAGVSRLRIDLVREGREETAALVQAYRDLTAGRRVGAEVLASTGARDHVGVHA